MNDLFKSLTEGLNLPTTPGVPEGLTAPAAPLTSPFTVRPITPVALALPLLDYQEEAVAHALRDTTNHPYAYCALDMGLGKTPVGIAVAAALSAAGIKRTLVVVPPSLRINWRKECKKFAPHLRVGTIKGGKPEADEELPEHLDVVIVGDSSLMGWADFLTGKVGALIVDEAHRFKNKSKRSDALVQIATGRKTLPPAYKGGRAQVVTMTTDLPRMRLLLSGTPTPNGRHTELPTQIDVLGREAWTDIGGMGMFWHHYAPKVDQYSRANSDGAGLYKAMSASWYFRRLRDKVIDLPAKGRTALALEAQYAPYIKRYKEAHDDIIAYLAGKQDGKVSWGQRRAQAIIKLNVMRHYAGLCKTKSVVEHVKSILDEEPGGVFIVAEHTDVMDELLIGLVKYKPVAIQGGMSDLQKDDAVTQFTSGKSRVMVGQITAAGVGLTLHGDGINHRVVVAQLPWTPAELKQAEDRLHRIGQTHDVMVEVALCAIDGMLTIDERLWSLLSTKNFNSTLITDGEGEDLLDSVQDSLLDSYR